jgi:hypothetical protein
MVYRHSRSVLLERKYFGELTATLAADIRDAPNIEDLHLPWFVETTDFFLTGAPTH